MNGADDLDRAADLTQSLTDSAVAVVRNAARPEQVQVDGVWPTPDCVECEEQIPAKRLALGKIRCLHCQQLLERRRGGL